MREKYRWEIDPAWLVWLPGVVPALNIVCRAYGDDGDEVVAFTPVYPPFLAAPPRFGKTLRTIPLRREGGLYTFDAERFEREISSRSRILLLCNPHNPVGRRYDRREIECIAQICVAHDILICSDEIHCDLILDGGPHIPTATLGAAPGSRSQDVAMEDPPDRQMAGCRHISVRGASAAIRRLAPAASAAPPTNST